MKNIFFACLVLLFWVHSNTTFSQQKVTFKNDDNGKKIQVYLGGQFFTAFIYPSDMEKQTLYPIVSASGKTITRGYPLNPRPFERTDHPHHVGLWFNFGNVNGLDFWNNSFAIKPEEKSKYGSIKFQKIVSQNPKKGELVTSSDWVDINNQVLMNEVSTFIFSGSDKFRSIERTAKLSAVKPVTFTENKEGMLGLRVDRAFEEPATKPEKFLDANGNVTEVPVLNNEGVNGIYRNAEGVKGAEVWGKRSPWVALRANKDGEVITIVLFDNPKNLNYPGWSHARGYGLFAHNNLGGRVFDPKAAEVKVTLQPSQSITFKYKVVIGGDFSDAEINKMAK
ncbi:MAG TPA: PmoA family protein [Bacteroidales bacterium]|nr:PmoA family protein [Bacteroidales bacterium]